MWQDDRWNPTKFSHPHRNDNVNFPEQEYTDMFGGTLGEKEQADYEHHKLDLFGESSPAIRKYRAEKSRARRANEELAELNKQDHKSDHHKSDHH
jgi:hypothetical protein